MAKTMNYIFQDDNDLYRFIELNELNEFPNLLVQVFCGQTDRETIIHIQDLLTRWLVNAKIIGCTTAGEISDGLMLENQIVLSFTIFEKVELKSSFIEFEQDADSFQMGENFAAECLDFDTKGIILFFSSYLVDPESFLNGIYKHFPDISISGGGAGSPEQFDYAYVFTEQDVTSFGIVAVALKGSHLNLKTHSTYEFQAIGKSFTVTKAEGNTILTIDHKKPTQILKNYLGDGFSEGLPQTGIEFPLIINDEKKRLSLSIYKVFPNGGILVDRRVKEGDKLTFAYTHIKMVIDQSLKNLRKLSRTPFETIFIYNCLAKKQFMRDFTEQEINWLNGIATTTGFFSNGEIAKNVDGSPVIVGHSLTYLAISENEQQKQEKSLPFHYNVSDSMQTMITLTNLMEASQADIRKLNEDLNLSEQYYRSLFNNDTDFVFATDLHGNITSINQAFKITFGVEDEVIGRNVLKFVNNKDVPLVRMHFMRALKGKEQYYTIELTTKHSDTGLFQVKNIPITVNGETVGIYGIGRDITEQKRIEDKMVQLAYYDHDTGLPNRIKFTEQLEEMLTRAKKKKNRQIAVLFIDIDRFKIINDSLGHAAGDLILKELSFRIKSILPTGSFLGRFSGDKFSLILTKDIHLNEIKKISSQILKEVSKVIVFDDQEFFVTASIGISMYPDDGVNEDVLLKNADVAMNRAKQLGGNGIVFFSTEMNDQAKYRLELESSLRKALERDQFFLCYQPLVDLDKGKIYGSEALIRWEHPKYGLVSPADFIPLAEETGIIKEIGNWVLRTACIQNKKWQELGYPDLTISVNVSAIQFQQPKFLKTVQQALKESGLEPQFLTLELTESAMLRNIDYSIDVMKALQEMGVKVSIDDFGTGYSSLSYLRNLPINHLKIDRSFINNLRADSADIAIVKAIITMGYGLSVKVVAEGVETKEQIELLKELKCHYVQGYYIHKPLKSNDFENDLNHPERYIV